MGFRRDQRRFFAYLQDIRDFFNREGFLDCPTPPVVAHPGAEVHLHPFRLHRAHGDQTAGGYLHTSPEFAMKALLAEGLGDIFTLSYAFRDEPQAPLHRAQFLLLEWYRRGAHYHRLMDDCARLLSLLKGGEVTIEKATVDDIFADVLGFNITDFLDENELRALIAKDFKDIHLDGRASYDWDDYFFLVFTNRIEPVLRRHPYLILYEYPAPLCALATIKQDNPKVCERFELYVGGVEVANAFNELEDLEEQRRRFAHQALRKKELYGYELPEAKVLFDALAKGIGGASGVALGVERLYGELFQDHPFWD